MSYQDDASLSLWLQNGSGRKNSLLNGRIQSKSIELNFMSSNFPSYYFYFRAEQRDAFKTLEIFPLNKVQQFKKRISL